jgi:hypothetical protein
MTDNPFTPRPGSAPDGGTSARDEQLAALLAVSPLDPHTRRRLVRRALDEAPRATRRRSRVAWVAAAAAVLVVITVAGGVVLSSGTDHTRPPFAVGPGARNPTAAGPSTLGAGSALHDLGDVGDITDPVRLRQVVAGPARRPSRSLGSVLRACGDLAATARLVSVDTVATGVDAGQPVAVVVGPDAAGPRVVAVVALRGCTVLQRFALG